MAEPVIADPRVARARAGDELAFTELYDEYAPRVYRFLLLRVRQPADAEDLLQRVFLKVIEALPGFEERGLPFGAWLFRIARNTAIDFERARRAASVLDDLVEQPDELPGPAALAEQALARARVREALATLTDEQRDVVAYRFLAGLGPAEIGRLMGKREGTVRALQFRALQALRKLGRESFDDLLGSVQ
jgi:RNA polymerase sigma-70 factor (ECF subfamily)